MKRPAGSHLRAREQHAARWRAVGLHRGLVLDEEIRLGLARWPGTRLVIESEGVVAELTPAALYGQALQLAQVLAGFGFRAGDVIAVQLPNGPEHLLTFLAALRLGVVFVPVVMIYGAAELGFILRQSGARALVIPGKWRNVDMAARIRALPELPGLERLIMVGDALPSAMPWEEMLRQPRADLPELRREADEVCVINYTSGTTSAPKGVMHTHNTIAAEVRDYPGLVDAPGDDSPSLSVVPAGHIGGVIFMLCPFIRGSHLIFMNLWDAAQAARLVRTYGVSHVGGVPLHLNAMLDMADRPASIRAGNTGGAGVPPALIERADAMGVRITRSYGSTEHPTVSGSRVTDPLRQRAYTDGQITTGNAVRIVGEDGRELPPGEPGEILSMGPELFVGYLDGALDADAFTPDGWYRSGDIGVADRDGCITVVDRKKDIIIRGGENISSQDVEGVLSRHPAVQEAVAVAWPDRVYGERVGVFVRLRPGCALDMPDVKAHFEAQGVARQKTPERLVVVDDFERTAMGKVVKAALRRRVAEMVRQSPEGG